MFKEENIELYCKLFCFIIFLIVIIFLSNIYSLLILFAYFFLVSRKVESNIVLFFYMLTLLGITLGFINEILWLLKLALVIDFSYYFVGCFKKNKRSSLFEKNVKEYVSNDLVMNNDDKDKIFSIDNEFKKGKLLKEEEVLLIKSHLEEKEKDKLMEREILKYLRFSKFKSVSKSYKWKFKLDDINGMYIICHLVILILAIVVE